MNEDPLYWRIRITKISMEVRKIAQGSLSLEDAAARITGYLYRSLNERKKACSLARIFYTLPYHSLPTELQRSARDCVGGQVIPPASPCLALLGTTGDEQKWCSRHTSSRHKVLPLLAEDTVSRWSMFSALFSDFGIPLHTLVTPGAVSAPEGGSAVYPLFHVPEASDTSAIPDQESFVRSYGIRSVIGFGGPLPGGHLFTGLLFFTVHLPPALASLFRAVALSAELALLDASIRPVFREAPEEP